MRYSNVLVICFAAVLAPVAAFARDAPSLVELLLAPGAYTVSVTDTLLGLPILLGIAFIKALVIRKQSETSLLRMTGRLIAINLVTTFAGVVYAVSALPLWVGFFGALLATTALEWLLLFTQRSVLRVKEPEALFKLALRMNAVSYGLIALVILGLLSPTWEHTDRAIAREFPGVITLSYQPSLLFLSRDAGSGGTRVSRAREQRQVFALAMAIPRPYAMQLRGKNTVLVPRGAKSPVCTLPYDLINGPHDVQFSANGRWLFVSDDSGAYLYELPSATRKRIAPRHIRATFNPSGDRLALSLPGVVIYNCATGAVRNLHVPGNIDDQLVWSPDGRYLAYCGKATSGIKNSRYTDVRVIRLRDGKSTSIFSNLDKGGPAISGIAWGRE